MIGVQPYMSAAQACDLVCALVQISFPKEKDPTMRRVQIFGFGLGLATMMPVAALATGLNVADPSIVVAPIGQSAAVFLQLENSGTQDERLIRADAGDIAHGVSLHTHVAQPDGSKRMMPATAGIDVPAGSVHVLGRGGNHALGRGGDHSMFLDLARMPEPGEEVPLTLFFESGAEISLQIPVARHPTAADQG